MKIDNFKKTKTFINTKEIQTGDLLRIKKIDGQVFEGIVLFNTGFKYYNKNNNEFRDIMLNETDASDIESIEILNREE
jgi:kynurenine formamidase|nr:MAG TPA: PROTEIN/RNA Complex, Ribosomal protein, Metal-binding, RNA-binding.4A [Caudoviricetes sp.]